MNRMLDPPARPAFPVPLHVSSNSRTLPILSSASQSSPFSRPSTLPSSDPMDISSHSSVSRMRPPAQTIPEEDQSEVNASNGVSPRQNGSGSGTESNGHSNDQHSDGGNRSQQSQHQQSSQSSQQSQQPQGQSQSLNSTPQQPSGAAAAAQQPKVVQTAFIHKLYSMLQDTSIQHLITWSNSNESFLMNPSSEFAKVLSQYFKHTNISSFVRQLNMYGFHKVSDVFHTGSPDSTMWEFKHGNGNFKKGDVASLREIKRRASRHTLIHRDSFSTAGHKLNSNHQGTSHEPQDGPEARFLSLEHSVYEMHTRLNRMEESHALLSSKCQVLTESLIRCHQWTNSMSYFINSLVPESNPVCQEIANMQREVSRQLEAVRAMDNPHESLNSRPPHHHYGSMAMDPVPSATAPLSPRQISHEDSHRGSLRPPLPHTMGPQGSFSSHRYSFASPSHSRPPPPTQHTPHPLSNVTPSPSVSTGRRHTSADIREYSWGPQQPTAVPSPFNPGPGAAPSYAFQWPHSPHRDSDIAHQSTNDHQQVRDMLNRYEMGGPRCAPHESSRRHTPPPPPPAPSDNVGQSLLNPEPSWSLPHKFPHPAASSVPATRRSSMASNVHSLLNPADTHERDEEEMEDRKRKRLQ